ncbi:class I SAM-dependent methyltransferase [Yoonia sp.]|uniref:class I SAM-dependent methyltransferase n=1 Tax=Yoonia sp. TaxID=2212373 RepID=UPI00391AB268
MADATHAALMDRTYRYQRRIYDATRAFYLLGRDHLIAKLDPPKGGHVLEIACGTGRNLDHIAQRFPDCALYGLDISEEMLTSARNKLGGRAVLAQGDACDFDPNPLFGVAKFDRIIFSYCLSMIPDWAGALEQSLRRLAPGGSLHIVDFGGQQRLPGFARRFFNAWLARFYVTPRHDLAAVVQRLGEIHGLTVQITDLHRSYAQYAVLISKG